MLAENHGYIYDLLQKLGLSDFGARTGEFLVVQVLKFVLVYVAAVILSRLGARWLRRSVRSIQLRTPLLASSPRAEQRAATIAEVLASLLRAIVWFVAVLIVLDQLGVNLAPLLAGAGIAGIAVGFGAQSLVKDVISGLFILVEDQYGVGDVVDLGDTAGTVEDVNLRVTRLRAVDGRVWFVPNGEIRRVGNSSMGWARAVVDMLVGHDVEMDTALAAIRDEADRMATEPAFVDKILEPPELWGVEAVGPDGVTVRVVLKTKPNEQQGIARELLQRCSARLQRDGAGAPGRRMVMLAPTGAGPTGAASGRRGRTPSASATSRGR